MGGLLQMKRRSLSSFIVILLSLFWAFFLAIFLERSVGVVSGLEYSKDKQASSLTLERIRKHLDKINKPAIMTIESPDGDIIDCIDKWKQPAFDHPLLKNHKLQMVPPEMPRVWRMKGEEVKRENHTSSRKNEERVVISGQVWHRNRTRCPKGTVPIRRTTVDDVLRAQSLYDFGKKQPRMGLARHSTVSPDALPNYGHEYAEATLQPSEAVYGATGRTNLWNPSLQVDTEMSLSQIWVVAGSYSNSDLNTLEAGWQVQPILYGDKSTRFFAYWTADAYRSTGCYNTLCPGFVQVDQRIVVGMAIDRVSTISGMQYDVHIVISKDPKTGNWWLYWDNTAVGYWPSNLFTHLAASAATVQWGGEVVNKRSNGAHTSTQMGSGRFAQEGYGKASYFRNLGFVDSNNVLISSPQDISTHADNSNCYNINLLNNDDWGTYFYYGGSGFNPYCP